MNNVDRDDSEEVYLPPEGLKDTVILEYIREERGIGPQEYFEEPTTFIEWREKEAQQHTFQLLYSLPQMNTRTPSYPEYTFCRDKFNEEFNSYLLRDYKENRENVYRQLQSICTDGPSNFQEFLQTKLQPEITTSTSRGAKRLRNVTDPEIAQKRRVIIQGMLPWINDIAENLPVNPKYSNEEKQRRKEESITQIVEMLGIRMWQDDSTGKLQLSSSLDVRSLEYLAHRFQEKDSAFRDIFKKKPLSIEGISEHLMADDTLLTLIEKKVLSNPEVLVFHDLCTMLDFLSYPFSNKRDRNREKVEEDILLDIFWAINNHIQAPYVHVINDKVLNYIEHFIKPLYAERANTLMIPQIEQLGYASDLPLDTINEVFSKRLPNGIDGTAIVIKHHREFHAIHHGILGEVARSEPAVISLFPELRFLPYEGIEDAVFADLREMGLRERNKREERVKRILIHELAHNWLLLAVSEYYRSPASMSPKPLSDVFNDAEAFLLDYFQEVGEFKGNDIFSLVIKSNQENEYDPELLATFNNEEYAHEIFAELCCQADTPENFLLIRRELPGHYFMYRVLYEVRNGESIPYERFINALHEYLNMGRDIQVVRRFVDFAKGYK